MLTMSQVTAILTELQHGNQDAAERLFHTVYEELRTLAAAKMAQERPGQTLQATALVHEAYLRLLGGAGQNASWESRAHFFASAAEAMRRVLIDHARKKAAIKRPDGRRRVPLDLVVDELGISQDELLIVDEALSRLELVDRSAAELVKLRVFAGLSAEEAASILGVSPRTAYREWAFAQAWLLRELRD